MENVTALLNQQQQSENQLATHNLLSAYCLARYLLLAMKLV